MGFFSQDCISCGHPALCLHAVDEINEWMNRIVVVTPDGSLIKGCYDGYGTLDRHDGGQVSDVIGLEPNTVWHEACWEAAGRPVDYRGESRHSADQGWFFDEGAHSIPKPSRPQS